jgi:chemotaxis protein CheY-P-specific phosphatase CheC
MSNAAEKTLYRTAAVIFEELSFLLPNRVDRPIDEAPAVGAAVAFRGPFSGTLVLRITRNLVPILSANMLGDEQSLDEGMQHDAVGEIANVICGNVLPVLSSAVEPFHLESPRHFEGPVPGDLASSLASRTEVHVGLDSGKADVMLFVSNGQNS